MRLLRTFMGGALLLLAAGSVPLEAQEPGALEGRVLGAETAAPLASVEVAVRDADGRALHSTLTGESGRFRIDGIEPGLYTVAFELPGWATRRESGVRIRPGETTGGLSITLRRRAYELNPITVSAARQEERLLDAPASVSVVNTREAQENPAISALDYVDGMAGIDVIRSGLQQGYVVARGFNDVFSGSLLTLTDHRFARVPSLRANISHLDPTTNLEVESIEVVRGPGSALYGPNAAAGVMHTLTKSPIDDPGYAFSAAGGLREQDPVPDPVGGTTLDSDEEAVGHFEGRLAHRFDESFGLSVAGQWFAGEDFQFFDPTEKANEGIAEGCLAQRSLQNPACQVFAPALGELPEAERLERIADRDFDLERWKISAEAEVRPSENVTGVFSYGRTQAVNSIDLTGIGAAQVKDWALQYAQTRWTAGNLFAQAFVNWNQSGDTFILRTGAPIQDESAVFVGQVQHSTEVSDRQRFVYGVDYIHTDPVTNGTVNGIHEDDDQIDEAGLYLQSETQLAEKWRLNLALRGDHHSVLDERIVSPRAGVVFQPDEENSFRATYNRAFETPDNNNFFLDIQAQRVPLGAPGVSFGLRAQGTSDRGFDFRLDPGGRPMMQSPFTPAQLGGPGQFLPTRTQTLWQLAVGVVSAQNPQLGEVLSQLPVPSEAQVGIDLRRLNTGSGAPFGEPLEGDFSSIPALPALDEEIRNTWELGWKGFVNERLQVQVDAYYTLIEDFIGPLRVETPNAFLNGPDLVSFLTNAGIDPATAQAVVQGTEESTGIAEIPIGVVTPEGVSGDGANILLTYRNFGNVDLFGTDVSVQYQATDAWNLGFNVSGRSDDEFDADGEEVALNASTFAVGSSVEYRNEDAGFNGKVAYRFNNGFPANSGVFVGDVNDYQVVDLQVGYRLPTYRNLSLQIDVSNLTDTSYQSFPGSPELGRFALARLKWEY